MKNEVHTIEQRIEALLAPILHEHQAWLVELSIKGNPGSQMVKVFVDTATGVTLEQCERISRELSDQLDILDIIPGRYRLEVSSPGIGRPLKTVFDFQRNVNREVEVTYEAERGETSLRGKLVRVSDEEIEMGVKKDSVSIAFSKIKRGRVCLPW